MKGTWLTVRKDPRNQARADVSGHMIQAPKEVWRRPTGAEVLYAREFEVDGEPAVLVQAGATLQLSRWDGAVLWRNTTLGAASYADTPVSTCVSHVADFDGDGRLEVLYHTDVREVKLLDLATGEPLWTWETAPSSFIIAKFLPSGRGLRFICFPTFTTEGWCWDFTGNRTNPRLVWRQDYADQAKPISSPCFLKGYGPSILLADMNGDGRPEIVVSGKATGNIIYQGVLNAENGDVLFEGRYPAELGSPIISGRPYGLTRAVDLDGDGLPDIFTAACLVEEHYVAARNTGKGFERIWGRAVEKDFPEDHRELQPRLSSVANLRAKAGPDVVLGLWEDGRWRTLVIEASTGRLRGELLGQYFWGCADLNGNGRDEIVVSREVNRHPGQPTTLVILDGETLQPIAELPSAAVFPFTSALLSPLPDDTTFLAMRRDPVFVPLPEGGTGILVRTFKHHELATTAVWGGRNLTLREIAGPQILRADVQDRLVLLSDGAGYIHRYDADLQPTGQSLPAYGRAPKPLVWRVGDRTELVFDESGTKVTGGAVDYSGDGRLAGKWSVRGAMPALHVDRRGYGRVVMADINDEDRLISGTSILQVAHCPGVMIYKWPIGGTPPLRIELEHPPYVTVLPYGEEFRVLVNMQTGVHTNSLACYNAEGDLLWRDEARGTYPKPAGVGDINGDGQDEVVADDHGYINIYDQSGRLLIKDPAPGPHGDGGPAYTLPIMGPFGNNKGMLLRSSGIDGLQVLDGAGKSIWLIGTIDLAITTRSSRYFSCLGSVADLTGKADFAFGIVAEDGIFECVNLSDGSMRWALDLGCKPANSSVVSGDLTGNGRDAFLVGLPDGRLVCLGEQNGQGKIVWQLILAAGVAGAIIADVDGDGVAEVVAATHDGFVRVLK